MSFGPLRPLIYLQIYSLNSTQIYLACKASKLVYLGDNHVTITTSYFAFKKSLLVMTAIFEPPSWILKKIHELLVLNVLTPSLEIFEKFLLACKKNKVKRTIETTFC